MKWEDFPQGSCGFILRIRKVLLRNIDGAESQEMGFIIEVETTMPARRGHKPRNRWGLYRLESQEKVSLSKFPERIFLAPFMDTYMRSRGQKQKTNLIKTFDNGFIIIFPYYKKRLIFSGFRVPCLKHPFYDICSIRHHACCANNILRGLLHYSAVMLRHV